MNRAARQTGRIALRARFPGLSPDEMEQAWTQPVVTGVRQGVALAHCSMRKRSVGRRDVNEDNQ